MEETNKNKEQKYDALTAAYMLGRYDDPFYNIHPHPHSPHTTGVIWTVSPEIVR